MTKHYVSGLLFIFTWTLVGAVLRLPHAHSQTLQDQSIYRSPSDELLTIEKITSLPFVDNAQGIYARPLEVHMTQILSQMHRWDFIPVSPNTSLPSPETLENDREAARLVSSSLNADAFFTARITKTQEQVSIKLNLFLTKDSLLIAQEQLNDFASSDIESLKEQLTEMTQKIISRIPYKGQILSRQGTRVTLNLGSRDNVHSNQVISVIQLIQLTRHPRFHFLVSSEKEILGRIRLVKVEETLSFGVVLSERSPGAIQKQAKIAGLDFVTYSEAEALSPGLTAKEEAFVHRSDKDVSFGENPRAWVPTSPPTFGQVGARFGLGLFQGNTQLAGGEALDASSNFAPQVFLDGELWVTSKLSVLAGLKQGIIPVDNPRPGSSPGKLNQSLSSYELLFGYTMRFGPDVWGPYLQGLLGYMSQRLYVDDSTPTALTTQEFSGFKTGVKGAFPVTVDRQWSLGAQLYLFLYPRMHESPVTSGASSKESINQFGVFGSRKLGERLKLQINLDFDIYSTNFSGVGSRGEAATNSSQRYTTLSGGIYYMF